MLDTAQSAATNTPDIDLGNFLETQNLVQFVGKEKQSDIVATCTEGLEADKKAMQPWLDKAKEAMEMAQMDGSRDLPFDKASDVRAPTLASAAIQFASRAYPTIMADNRPVRVAVYGEDPDGIKKQAADRVSKMMSWQFTEGMDHWEEELDRLLYTLPITGCVVKKVYFCQSKRQTVSDLVPMDCLTVNPKAPNRHDLRVTQSFELQPHHIEERVRRGLYARIDWEPEDDDKEAPQEFCEHHCRLDLDEDGYAEPYIVTIHKEAQQIVRIQANYGPQDVEAANGRIVKITAASKFVFFPFLPDPENPVLGQGYGQIMLRLGASINSILNQLIDAGTLQNTSGGLISKSVKLGNNERKIKIDEWQWGEYDTSETPFLAYPKPQPSTVLFSLLGFLIDMTKEIASTTDAMTGDVSQNMQPTTLLALIEQGQKVYTAVYKRIYRALKQEYQAVFRVNAQNMRPDVVLRFHDTEVAANDFMLDEMDVSPQADPNMSSDMVEMARAGVLQNFMNDPLFDQMAIRKRILEAGKIDPEGLLAQPQQGPDPAAMLEMEKLNLESDKLATEERKVAIQEEESKREDVRLELEVMRSRFDNLLKHSQSLAAIMTAEAKEQGQQLAEVRASIDAIQSEEKMMMEFDRDDHQRRMDRLSVQPGMEGDQGQAAPGLAGAGQQNGSQVAGPVPRGNPPVSAVPTVG